MTIACMWGACLVSIAKWHHDGGEMHIQDVLQLLKSTHLSAKLSMLLQDGSSGQAAQRH